MDTAIVIRSATVRDAAGNDIADPPPTWKVSRALGDVDDEVCHAGTRAERVVERVGQQEVALGIWVQVLEHQLLSDDSARRGFRERSLNIHQRGTERVGKLAHDVVHRFGRAETQKIPVRRRLIRAVRRCAIVAQVEDPPSQEVGVSRGIIDSERFVDIGERFVERSLAKRRLGPGLAAGVVGGGGLLTETAREGRVVALVARERREEDRDTRVCVAHKQVGEIGSKLIEPAMVEIGVERDVALPYDERHQRARRVDGSLLVTRCGFPKCTPETLERLEESEIAHAQESELDRTAAGQHVGRSHTEDPEVLVMSGIDENGVGGDGDDLIGEVEQRVRVHGRHRRADHLHLAVGKSEP